MAASRAKSRPAPARTDRGIVARQAERIAALEQCLAEDERTLTSVRKTITDLEKTQRSLAFEKRDEQERAERLSVDIEILKQDLAIARDTILAQANLLAGLERVRHGNSQDRDRAWLRLRAKPVPQEAAYGANRQSAVEKAA